MSSIALNQNALYLFHRSQKDSEALVSIKSVEDDTEVPGIRCPLCRWKPTRQDQWVCWDCEYPENFFAGCGTEWNTFLTNGVCPTCLHRWKWTSCLKCKLWSKHVDWYEGTRPE